MTLTAFDPPELQRFTRAFEELFYADDPVAMTTYYTEDAQLMAEGMQPIQGHAAITQFWRAAITRATAAGAQRTIRLHESHTSGDLGYALCTVTVQIPASSNAAAANIAVWDATIWRRDPGGTWRIAVDISTPLPRLRSRTEPSVTEYRVSLDAAVSFSNGGDLTVHGNVPARTARPPPWRHEARSSTAPPSPDW